MLTESDVRRLARRTIERFPTSVGTAATEVRISSGTSGLTRIANNDISQTIDKDRTDLSVRVLLGPAGSPRKAGAASTNRIDDAGLDDLIGRAMQAAELQQDDPRLIDPPGPQSYTATDLFDAATADCPPARRAEALADVLARCRREALTCGGAFATGGRTFAIANSAGLFACDRRSNASLSLTVSRDGGASGWDEQLAGRVDGIDPSAVADRACEIASRADRPKPFPPGPATVVLPPAAVRDLLAFLTSGGLLTKPILEGRSFFSGKLGRRVFGENVTITDDAFDPQAAGMAFDGEGLPRQRVPIIDRGVFAGMVHGRETARLADARPTGHGLTPPSAEGAVPANLVVAPGQASLEELIASVERGLLMTHFHYTNMLRPADLTITGMTRDGLFLIENGRVGPAVNNMRFTESLVRALSNVRTVGRDAARVSGWGVGYFVTPPLLIDGFNFSSATEF